MYRFNKGLEVRESIRAYSNYPLGFYTGTAVAPRLFLATSGNVAIGHDNPLAKLDVKGEILLSGSNKVLKTLDGEMCITAEEGIDIILDNNANSNNNQTAFRVALHNPVTGVNLLKVLETGLTTVVDFKISGLANTNATTDRLLGIDALGNVKTTTINFTSVPEFTITGLASANATTDRMLGVGADGKLKTIVGPTTSASGDTVFFKSKYLKIGENSLYLGSQNSGQDNSIHSWDGPLDINPDFKNVYIANNWHPTLNGGVGIKLGNTLKAEIESGAKPFLGNLHVAGTSHFGSYDHHVKIGYDGASCIIDACGSNPLSDKGLLMNYYSGANVTIGGSGEQASFGIDGKRSSLSVNGSITANVVNGSTDVVYRVYDHTANINRFAVRADGEVFASAINVLLPGTVGFPDYVFNKNYNLMSLSNLEKYIETNNHLPNIPTAKTVAENGINVAELQVKQMEKIEELTLYLIAQQKLITQLQTKVELLENK